MGYSKSQMFIYKKEINLELNLTDIVNLWKIDKETDIEN